MGVDALLRRIREDIDAALHDSIGDLAETIGISQERLAELKHLILHLVFSDLHSLATGDPAAQGNKEFVYNAYSSFKAVMYYRIANEIYYALPHDVPDLSDLFRQLAVALSDKAKTESGIDIHPAARIGPAFVIDHGVGTVIGQTSVIGARCYILQGVVLGSTGVKNNPDGPRHPQIGDDVEIAAFAKLLGPVTIGNDVFIGPHCIITSDIPDESRVTLATQCQIQRSHATPQIDIYGVVPSGACLRIYGFPLEGLTPRLLDHNYDVLEDCLVASQSYGTDVIELQLHDDTALPVPFETICLGLFLEGDLITVIRGAIGMKRYFQSLPESVRPQV